MSENQNVETIRQIYADFGRGNIPGVLAAFTEDVEHQEPPAGQPPFRGTYRGLKEVGGLFMGMHDAIEVEEFEPQEFFSKGETVVALGRYRFRVRANGNHYETDWTMVWRFRDGKVASWKTYKDSAAEAAALRTT